ncbi:MAG: S-adenosylmethionine decarboxylase proenzyme [Armatimonadetes bacterium]|nr:S-adenosylmethionine decarboxylase proenzyme [Armatimonadota bacterium]
MMALGRHIIAELSYCDADLLGDLERVQEAMVRAARVAGCDIREVAFHRFQPHGVSGVVVIAESHLSIHTWPELRYAAVDVYTCGTTTDPMLAIPYLEQQLGSKDVNVSVIQRGVPTSTGAFSHVFTVTEEDGILAS